MKSRREAVVFTLVRAIPGWNSADQQRRRRRRGGSRNFLLRPGSFLSPRWKSRLSHYVARKNGPDGQNIDGRRVLREERDKSSYVIVKFWLDVEIPRPRKAVVDLQLPYGRVRKDIALEFVRVYGKSTNFDGTPPARISSKSGTTVLAPSISLPATKLAATKCSFPKEPITPS